RYERAAEGVLHSVVKPVARVQDRCLEGCTKTLNGIDVELRVGCGHELEDVLETGLKLRLLRGAHCLATPLERHLLLLTRCDELPVRDALLLQRERRAPPRLSLASPCLLGTSLRLLLAPVGPGRDRPFALECGTRIELAPPCKHWLREDVVEDLVPATVVASIGDGSQDPLRCESLENRL